MSEVECKNGDFLYHPPFHPLSPPAITRAFFSSSSHAIMSNRKDVAFLNNLPVRIRHFALDNLRNAKIWYYAVIGKAVPVPLRNDYDVTTQERWLIESSAPAQIMKRREKLLKARNRLAKYIIAPSIVYWLTKLLS